MSEKCCQKHLTHLLEEKKVDLTVIHKSSDFVIDSTARYLEKNPIENLMVFRNIHF